VLVAGTVLTVVKTLHLWRSFRSLQQALQRDLDATFLRVAGLELRLAASEASTARLEAAVARLKESQRRAKVLADELGDLFQSAQRARKLVPRR
jgi:hypothetical protein